MPKRSDIHTVLIIGSGPIVIGQAGEFDYSGSQACKSLREEGVKTVVVNPNPATIQTDIEISDAVYIKPLVVEYVEDIIRKEKIDGIIPSMGGQTALNLCSELAERGILDKYNVDLLGTKLKAIQLSENRELFRNTMKKICEPVPQSFICTSIEDAMRFIKDLGFPVMIRCSYTLGGTGSSIVNSMDGLERAVHLGLRYSRINQVIIEECVSGWKEFEYEVMRDAQDNCITVCSMENLDPMGIHTGESIVIAPAQTLTDKDNQMLRSASIKIIRTLEIEGGCNIQFAFNTLTGEYRVVEVNPRVSRSSALASKATGYPIARIAAKIALGLTLDEIKNPITGKTYASFEPTLDYVVLKIPRWPFDKFRTANNKIGTQMKSTGEVMAIGRTVEEVILKAISSLDIDRIGFYEDSSKWTVGKLMVELVEPTDIRIFAIAEALRRGYNINTIADLTKWSPYFINKIANIIGMEYLLRKRNNEKKEISAELLFRAKKFGFSDEYIARLTGRSESEIRDLRKRYGIKSTFKMVDTCAGEFEAKTPYFYSTYSGWNCESNPKRTKKVLIMGSGPFRIGQSIEFDYCCVHGVFALKEEGIETIIINNNPETVSTDFDISDKLYFEPITFEHVVNIIENEDVHGIIVQFGGQTAINLGVRLQQYIETNKLKTEILGTSVKSINIAEDRGLFCDMLKSLNILYPKSGIGYNFDEVRNVAENIGYPILLRPSYVLGGRSMEIIYTESELESYMKDSMNVSAEYPILVDKYLTNAIEIDVDCVCDGNNVFVGGILEHIEEAGVHSGDASMVLPPQTLSEKTIQKIEKITTEISRALKIVGLINLQMAYKDGKIYVLEANPRASRTIPFTSKAIGIPLAKIATKLMIGRKLSEFELIPRMENVYVKLSVFSFDKLPGVDCILGPEMKSTGEVMGSGYTFGDAYYEGMLATGTKLRSYGTVYVTVRDADKPQILPVVKKLVSKGWKIVATRGTAEYLRKYNVPVKTVYRISEKLKPDVLSLMRKGEIDLVINTPTETTISRKDGYMMRRLAIDLHIPFITTVPAAKAVAESLR